MNSFNLKILALSLFCIFSTYCNDSKLKVIDIENNTEWKVLLKLYTVNKVIKYRLNGHKSCLWHNQNVRQITIEPYGNFLKWMGKTKVVYETGKEKLDNLLGIKLKINSNSSFKWTIDKEFINNLESLPVPISSIKLFFDRYLPEIINQCWDKLNRNPSYVKSVLDNLTLEDIRYLQGIPKDPDYDSIFGIFNYNHDLIEHGLSYNLKKSSIFIQFIRTLFKYAFIKNLINDFDKYKDQMDIDIIKKLITTNLAINVYSIMSQYNKIKDKKELLDAMEANLLNEMSVIVS